MFAEAKDWHGMREFRLRRLERVNIEALMIAAGKHVKRLLAFGDRGPRRSAQAAALRPPERSSARLVRHHRMVQQGLSQQASYLRWYRSLRLGERGCGRREPTWPYSKVIRKLLYR